MNNPSTTAASQARDGGGQRRTPAEQVTFGIALSILALTIGLVVYVWLFTPQGEPVLQITQGTLRQQDGYFYVPFTVENTGGNTAEMVQVIGELSIAGQVVEDGEQQIDFLSGGETAEGAFIFSRNPEEGELTLRVASYKEP